MEKNSRKNFNGYFIGLDLGTDSLGWAVTDRNYKLLRINNKNLWGVRLFETAQTAKDRRMFRAARRRLQRRKWRLDLLREIFAPAINSIDPNFFMRLSDSNLYDGDKRESTWFSLFSDNNFNDRDFHRKYKTVYHLRKAMAEEADPDPRLVYLALHHIIKNRGHFLIDGDMQSVNDVAQPIRVINSYLADRGYGQLSTSCIENFCNLLVTLKCGKKDRASRYAECFGVAGEKDLCALLELIAGGKVKLKNLPIDFADDDEVQAITFDTDWEAVEEKVRSVLGDDYLLIENAKLVYDYAQLKKLLGEHATLSEAMVAKYDKQRSDLALLKKVLRKYFDQSVYDDMFKTPPKGKFNYTTYCGKTKFGAKGTKIVVEKKCASYEDFAKYVREVLAAPEASSDEDIKYILTELDNGTFLPKQVSKNNATVPYQLNLQELDAILQNVCRYPRFEFLNECDADGISGAEKIRRIMTFRIPYFVGPVNNSSGKYWVVRREGGRILPWNISDKIDYDETEKEFIERMTMRCSYLPDEKVLPRCSLLYEEYVFLNTIGSIRINGELLSGEQKQSLSEFAVKERWSKITSKAIKKWLTDSNEIAADEDVRLEGFDEGAPVNRRMYCNFVRILGKEQTEQRRDAIENIIYDLTVASDEKDRLRKRLQKTYTFLSEQQIKDLLGLTCNGWGKCSQKFLTLRVGVDPSTGEIYSLSVIDALRNLSGNFMQIYNQYGFKQYFESAPANAAFDCGAVDELYCSPAVKKQIRQALCVVKEIRSILGCDPAKIFVEVAREKNAEKDRDRERNRTRSRLQELREKLRNDKELLEKLNEVGAQPRRLNENKLFLYFLQGGKDIYTGDPIDYNNLSLYDKDHIYPRSKVKDDSLDNLVLTYHKNNIDKADVYPIDPSIRDKMLPVWQALRKQNLMSEEKYRRLTRQTPLSDDEIMGFINRQLTETQQSTKETIKLLKAFFPNTEVVFSKAALVSEFRARQSNENVIDPITGNVENIRRVNFVKCREINDLHHAKDAYLNIVVGNVYNTRYSHNAQFMRYGVDRGPSDANIYDYDVGTGNNVAWVSGKEGTIAQVIKTMRSNTCLYTAESRTERKLLAKTSVLSKSKNPEQRVPLKSATNPDSRLSKLSDTAKYGGYDSDSRSYFMLVRYIEQKIGKKGVKRNVKYRLLGVPARYANALADNESRLEYCRECGLNEPQILVEKIKIGTFFRFGETMLAISGVTGNSILWRLAQQNRQDDETERYFKRVCDVVERKKRSEKFGGEFFADERDGVDSHRNILMYDTFVGTLSSSRYSGAKSLASLATKLRGCRQVFDALSLTDQCCVLTEIAKALQCNAVLSDLTLLHEGANCGKITTGNTFDDLSNICIVHRSVTGIFEQRIALADLDKTVENS